MMFFNVDGGRSRFSASTRQGACRQHFSMLMVGAPRFSGSTFTRGPSLTFFNIDGG
jgi:hypothetical protein